MSTSINHIKEVKQSKYNIAVSESDGKVVLYNTRTGMLIRVPDEAFNKLSSVERMLDPVSDRHIAAFLRRGYCVPANIDESEHFYSQYLRFHNEDATTLAFTVAVTLSCNYRCAYCFESDILQREVMLGSPDKLCQFIENVAAHNPGCDTIAIKWFGGEPLLGYDYMLTVSRRIKAFCADHGLRLQTRIITNGALMTSSMLNELLEYDLKSVQLSVDGCLDAYCTYKCASAADYHAVMKFISENCTRVYVNLRLNCYPANFESLLVLTRELYQDKNVRDNVSLYLAHVQSDVMETFDHMEYADAHIKFVEYLYELGWYSQVRNALPSQRSSPCSVLSAGNFIIDHNGNLYACENDIGSTEMSIGCDNDAVSEIEASKKALSRSSEQTLTSACRACAYFPICFSGCPKYPRSGDACAAFRKMVNGILKVNARIHV